MQPTPIQFPIMHINPYIFDNNLETMSTAAVNHDTATPRQSSQAKQTLNQPL